MRFVPCVPKTHGYRAFRTVRSIFSGEVQVQGMPLTGKAPLGPAPAPVMRVQLHKGAKPAVRTTRLTDPMFPNLIG